MTLNGWLQISFFLAAVAAVTPLLGGYMARVFTHQRTFVMYLSDHHGDGREALWCAAPEGAQEMLIDAVPEHYFRPPYVGHRGWVGVRLDRELGWEEIAGVIDDAHETVARKR